MDSFSVAHDSHQRPVLIKDATILHEVGLEAKTGSILVVDGVICNIALAPEQISYPDALVMDGSDWIVMPSFCNAHTHVMDGNEKERWIGYTVPELFSEGCLKEQWLSVRTDQEKTNAARDAMNYMFRCGSTATYIYIEEGLPGVRLVKNGAKDSPIDALFMGHPLDPANFDQQQIDELLEESDGVALCSLNPLSDTLTQTIHQECTRKNKIITTHMAEVKPTTNFAKAVDIYRPHFLVHGNYFSDEQLEIMARKNIGLVCCVRSGRTFLAQTPNITKLERMGIRFCFGTDNFFTNSPDMFQELEYVTRENIIQDGGKMSLSPERILRAATFDAFQMGGMQRKGLIKEGFHADFLVLRKDQNLRPFNGAISILLRATSHHILFIVKGGKFFNPSL